MRLCAEPDGRGERLTRQHVRTVKLAVDHAIEPDLPVGLRLERDEETLIVELPLLISDGERGHFRELGEVEGQHVLFKVEHFRTGGAGKRGRGRVGE